MHLLSEGTRTIGRLVENVADTHLRKLCMMVVDELRRLHPQVRFEATSVEVRFLLGDSFFCRLVPYRELLHFQVGYSPAWEVRVRDEKGCLEALDRCIEEYLRLISERMKEETD